MPDAGVGGEGLSWSWKEDGLVTPERVKRYGYRFRATDWGDNETDLWTYPDNTTGFQYTLRDTPSIAGEWGDGRAVWVWIELFFRGAVVEVESYGDMTYPVRVIAERSWARSWTEDAAVLTRYEDATLISNRGL